MRPNGLNRAEVFSDHEQYDRMRQDYLAGTVLAAGAGVALPTSGLGAPLLPGMFTVYINDDDSTYGPAPQLRTLLDLVDRYGAVKVHEMATIGAAWSGLDHPEEPMIKLTLDIQAPLAATGKVEIVLLAQNCADAWQHIAGGGMIGITTFERMKAKTERPGVTMADGREAGVLVSIGSSAVVETIMRNHDWPGA
ncbi:hypothetical protein GXW82_11160 [Streptacidiphilus sp. 4-A2]|nr:hypothetical protein [Streptacidiphilus sp. 4-A2]